MDKPALQYLDYIDNDTGDLVTGDRLNEAISSGDFSSLTILNDDTGDTMSPFPSMGAGLPTPAVSPPPTGYAWFYTPNNDRVPVNVAAIPSYYFQYLSPDQVNIPAQSLTQAGAPVGAGNLFSGGMPLYLLLGLGAYFLFFKKGSKLF